MIRAYDVLISFSSSCSYQMMLCCSTCVAGAIANKMGLTWETKEGTQKANYWGSLLMASTVKLGNDRHGNSVYTPMSNMLPLLNPNEIVWGGKPNNYCF